MTSKTAKYRTSVYRSIRFALGIVFLVALTLGVLVLPVAPIGRATTLLLLLFFVLAFMWHRKNANWELYAKRRTIATLYIVGTGLLAKASVSQIVQRVDIFGEVSRSPDGSDSTSVAFLLAVASAPWQVDIVLVLFGLTTLGLVLYFLRSDGGAQRIEVSLPFAAERSVPAYLRRASLDTYDSDLPPLVETWVGRERELGLLSEISRGVIAITGIGGQGKSALAATFLSGLREQSDLFWDWRDCREQADRFRLQLMSVIQHATDGEVTPAEIAEANIGWLSRYFFRKCSDIRGIVVFDNVDHYVDVEQSLFASSVSTFVDEALRVDHKLLVVFTCRPRISYASVRFREIYLRGLDSVETMSLFDKKIPGGIKKEQRTNVERIHKLTKGHPLWLNIIAAQISRNPKSELQIIENLEAGSIDERSSSMLRSIWNALHERQQTILSSMAELPRALEAEMLYEYLDGRVGSHNRFDRAFQGLRAISLIIEKATGGHEASRFELHPMVRAFVRTSYRNSTERRERLGSLLSRCEVIVARLSDNEGNTVSIALLENVTTKAELQLAMGNFEDCARTLVENFDQMVVKGITDEFVRLATWVLDAVDWNDQSPIEDETLDLLMEKVAHLMVEMGMLERLNPYLDSYTATVTDGTARHIGLCDIRTYVSWFSGNFDEAIAWGELGEQQKAKSGLDTDNDTSHNLALARRDSGDIDRALKYFLDGTSLRNALTEDHKSSKRDHSFYGNVGRCLALRGQFENALDLYAMSYDSLQSSATSQRRQLNLGYAAYWIAEALNSMGKKGEALLFYEHASSLWRRRAPQKAEEADDKRLRVGYESSVKAPEDIADLCRAWVAERVAI